MLDRESIAGRSAKMENSPAAAGSEKRETGTGQISEVLTIVTLNNQGLIDLLQAAVTGLKPKSKYQLVLVRKNKEPYGLIEPLTEFQTNPAGGGDCKHPGTAPAIRGWASQSR
jgi:hypothetical protein